MSLHHPGLTQVSIQLVEDGTVTTEMDELSVEEPMEIELGFISGGTVQRRSIAVTMRTPGNDLELALGFLFTEGIIQGMSDLLDIQSSGANGVYVTLSEHSTVDLAKLERHSFVSSSCGVCGKRSIAAVFTARHYRAIPGLPVVQADLIHQLPRLQRESQDNFHRTGGIHASALFDVEGKLLSIFEDVGRHNALDKLIGSELRAGRLPLSNGILLLSGRASFELIQKASITGIGVVASVGAPSNLAVQLARKSSMTLLGFVRENRFNIYADSHRIQFNGTSVAGVESNPTLKGTFA